MKLWLVRHAQPMLAAGICYGVLDVAADPDETQVSAQALAKVLPIGVRLVSSPLQRCEQLTQCLRGLRPDLTCTFDARLVEMDFGRWEGQAWDVIDRAELDAWTQAFDTWRCGDGQCVAQFMTQVAAIWDETRALDEPTVWITHAGVIRAATLLARGQRHIKRADQWPSDAPAWGQWRVLSV